MSTKIIDIELARAGEAFDGFGHYGAALFILRRNGLPIGLVRLPVHEGRIPAGTLREAIPPEVLVRWARAEQMEKAFPDRDEPSDTSLTATIAICTRERPDDLAVALTAATAVPHRGGGVLVVDNAPSTGRTREVVARFPGVRYVVEPRKGLDNARNRALAEATTDIVAFCDDDAVVDPGWLDAIIAAFHDPQVGCVTGLTLPLELENDAQEDFEELAGFSQRGFDRREFRSPPIHPLATGGIGAGANMAIRRGLVERIGPFDPALDAGTATMSGGDHDYFTRILRAGHTIIYEPRALNRHRHRRTRGDMLKAIEGYGTGVYAYWTRAFLVDGDREVFRRAFGWLVHDQLPGLVRSLLRRPKARPLDVALVELRGCARGPVAYVAERRKARQEGTAV